jgi:hypothetical protein
MRAAKVCDTSRGLTTPIESRIQHYGGIWFGIRIFLGNLSQRPAVLGLIVSKKKFFSRLLYVYLIIILSVLPMTRILKIFAMTIQSVTGLFNKYSNICNARLLNSSRIPA